MNIYFLKLKSPEKKMKISHLENFVSSFATLDW